MKPSDDTFAKYAHTSPAAVDKSHPDLATMNTTRDSPTPSESSSSGDETFKTHGTIPVPGRLPAAANHVASSATSDKDIQNNYCLNALIKVSAVAVLERLPRELRDEVYSHLWDEKTIEHYGFWQRAGSRHRVLPPFLDQEVVGGNFVSEVMDWLFHNARCIPVGAPKDLYNFLWESPYGVDIKAGDYRLRGLSFTVRSPQFLNKHSSEYCDLGSLLALDVKKDFKVYIKFEYGQLTHSSRLLHREVCKGLRKTISDLEWGGINVAVHYVCQKYNLHIDIKHLVGGKYAAWPSSCDRLMEEMGLASVENPEARNDIEFRVSSTIF